MRLRLLLCVLLVICWPLGVHAQKLRPGFDKEEYRALMHVSAHTTADTAYAGKFPVPEGFRLLYQSQPLGLENLWELWLHNDVAVISIRGTTRNPASWLANFYSAMVPAKGELQLSDRETFRYALSTDPKAAVHVGWLLSTAFLSREIVPKIDSLYQTGIRDVLLIGHSQGGAIGYLLTAYLRHLQLSGKLPSDIQFKTYCSAAPKPGNLYFAYEYETLTRGGWGFNVVNAADWVPETPIAVQTLKDLNTVNPFRNARKLIRKQKVPDRWLFAYIYNRLNNPIVRAQKNYERYLGTMLSKQVRKTLPGFAPPLYVPSNHFVRTGATIVLRPDAAYYKEFPDKPDEVFGHHLHKPYLYLLDKY
jgi:hypothetical protein